ncbi:M28 family peptidase [Rhodohalobacter halophilus]|uniref:M28 family peptidase n=1 Tax=Rhodohalobacter halophilus TaxID=1812810 RepID=UPI00083F56FB|nr:M28 family peptidase [Rhodohalobacter halophilus]
MNRYLLYFAPIITLFAISCGESSVDQAAQSITAESLMSHIEVISSDEFEGRAPATRGEDLTVDYLIETMEGMGIAPGMDDGSFTQKVPLLGQQVDGSSAVMNIRRNGQVAQQLDYRTEFMAWPSNEAERVQLRNAELLYVGYGIQAPEFEWDDYKGADVEGKVLVFKNSDPSNDPEIFEGDSRLYYGRWSYKFEKAEEMGALGAIIIHTTPTAGYGWSVIENSWGRERFALKGEEDAGSKPEFNGWMTEEQSEYLFDQAGLSLNEQLDAAENRNFEPVLLSGVTLDVNLSAAYSDMSTRNVLGQIKGSDPDLADEYVVFTAHYDHLGITTPVDGDSINNGALDNAAGVSAVLEMAKAYKEIEPEMRRSALFLFVGAEEMGLLGSLYWSQNPTVHPGKITANFNMDGMQVYGETEDVVLVGYGRNTITDVIKQYAEQGGRVVKPDPNPEQGFFYRSDHFSLARVGIPAIFPNPGRDYVNKPEDFIEKVDSLSAVNYHSVGDEINEYWDLSGMEKDVRLFFRSSFHILNADEMMLWEEGDEFQAIREEMLMQAP